MKGIYKITAPSGEVYIGQSVDIKRRVKDHRTTKKCKHKKLAASFDLHGVANHSFEVVHELPNDIDLATMHLYEQIYMDAYRDCGIALLNIKEAGYGKHGDETKLIIKEKRAFQVFSHESRLKLSASLKKVIHTPEWNKKVSEAQKGKIISIETRMKLMKPIIQKTITGEFIKEWDCSRVASKHFNVTESSICNCLTKRSKTAIGFIWEYKNTIK